MTDVIINENGYVELHNEANTLYRELSAFDERQPKIKIKANGLGIASGEYTILELQKLSVNENYAILCIYESADSPTAKCISLSQIEAKKSEIEALKIGYIENNGYTAISISDDIKFISINGFSTNSGETILIKAGIDSSGATTTYYQTSATAKAMSHDGAKFLLNKQELPSSFNVEWADAETLRSKIENIYGTKITVQFGWEAKLKYLRVKFYNGDDQVGGEWTDTLSASYAVVSKPFKPIACETIGSDSNFYYDSGLYDGAQTYYKKPSGLSFKITYDSGDSKTISGDDAEYFSDEALTENMIGKTVKPLTPVYVKVPLGDFVSNSYSLAILPTVYEDTVESVSVDSATSMKLTAQPISLKGKMLLLATFKSGSKMGVAYTGGENGYSFYMPNSYYVTQGDPLKVCVNMFGHTSKWFDISGDANLTFEKPKFSGCSLEGGDSLSTAVINGTPINLTDSKVRIKYDTGYVTYVPYDADGTANSFCVSSADDSALDGYAYDGQAPVTVDLGTEAQKTVKVNLMVYGNYGNSHSRSSVNFTFIEITDVLGMTYENAKTSYKVGEAFLNSDDMTKVRIWYESSGAKKSASIYLNGSFGALSISPQRGYVFSSAGTVTVRVQSIFDTTKYFTYGITVKAANEISSETETVSYRFVKYEGTDFNYESESGAATIKTDTYIKLLESDCVMGSNGSWSAKGELASSYDGEGIKIHGYLSNVGDKDHNGVLVDFSDCTPPISGASNMTISFPCYEEGMSDFVDKCTFGTRFGHNNSLNRLFLSGNPDKPNYDIHSVEPNLTNEEEGTQVKDGDFSYFPDEALCKYGEAENSIVGYDVVSDSKLMVLKNKSSKERTIYFRVPTTVTMVDSSGTVMKDVSGNSLTQEEYSIYMSNSSVAGISPSAMANFNGDSLFVDDDNEVAGLDVQGIIGDSQRQANSRSSRIDRKLREFDLSDANLEAYGRYLFLDVPGVACFVTDRDTLSGSQYEWWRLDSMGSRCFMEMGGELYYSTEDGMLCRLNGDDFSDKDRYFISVALTKIDYDSDVIVDSRYTDMIDESHEYTWRTMPNDESDLGSWLYAKILNVTSDMIDADNNAIIVNDAPLIRKISSGTDYWVNSLDGGFKEPYGQAHKLLREDDGLGANSAEYGLYDANMERIDLTGDDWSSGFQICIRLDGETTARKASDDGELKLYDAYGDPCDLVRYAGQSDSIMVSGVLTKLKPISSRLVSSPLLISSANWFKHIIKIDISQGTNDVSDICVAYCNNKIPYIVEDSVMDRGQTIDLGDFSFSSVDFSENFYTRTYTIGRELKCVKYVCVAFASDKGMNSVVPAVSLSYTLSRLSKGIGD